MRLTLRTLLAYLDDMLDPAETKLIGQKVAESEHAQELIARIKQVTRRRRLTTPPATGPNAFEPNTVSDYLDNTLPPEQVAEVEKACLESDVHLAEIAAAHQILTLVLGQPALVPPTARQRMYALVEGRRAARSRPVAAAATPNGAAAGDARADEDETLLLGLPAVGRGAVMRWLLPLAAVLLLAVLAIAIWQALPPTGGGTPVAANNGNATPPTQPSPPQTTHKEEPPPSDGGEKPGTPSGGNEGQKPGGGSSTETPAQPAAGGGSTSVDRPGPASRERREAGRYRLVAPSILVSRTAAAPAEPWKRLKSDDKVSTTDTLVSLPGYRSDLRLDSGVDLQLLGNTYELAAVPLLESAVILHAPAQGVDADFTLDRGAVKLTNTKDNSPAVVRIRFMGEVWDVFLKDPGTEIGMSLWSRHKLPYGSGEGPEAHLHLFVLKGRADVRVTPYREFDNIQSQPGAPSYVLFWDNKGRGAQPPAPAQDPESRAFAAVFSKPPRPGLPDEAQKQIEDANIALEAVSRRLSVAGSIETHLIEMLQPDESTPLNPLNVLLAVRCLGAIDAAGDLINLIGDADKPPRMRDEAISTLRHWIGRNDGQEARLYDPKTSGGLLVEGKKYSPAEAAAIMSLLHTLSNEQLQSPDTWAYLIENLKHDKLAIRELSYYHLRRLVPQKIAYNPADPPERREMAYKEWKKLIPDGKLPPPPQRP